MECVICFDFLTAEGEAEVRFGLGPNLNVIPCGHIFHRICILGWMEKDNTCPVCRKPLTKRQLKPVFLASSSEESGNSRVGKLKEELERVEKEKAGLERVEENQRKLVADLSAENGMVKKEKEEIAQKLGETINHGLQVRIALIAKHEDEKKHLLKMLEEEKGKWGEERGKWEEERGKWEEETGKWEEEKGKWKEEKGKWKEEKGKWKEEKGKWEEERGKWGEKKGKWEKERVEIGRMKSEFEEVERQIEELKEQWGNKERDWEFEKMNWNEERENLGKDMEGLKKDLEEKLEELEETKLELLNEREHVMGLDEEKRGLEEQLDEVEEVNMVLQQKFMSEQEKVEMETKKLVELQECLDLLRNDNEELVRKHAQEKDHSNILKGRIASLEGDLAKYQKANDEALRFIINCNNGINH